jgi:hypothetical protein
MIAVGLKNGGVGSGGRFPEMCFTPCYRFKHSGGSCVMKPVRDEVLEHLEETALECSKAIRAYLTYQGENRAYEHKARVAATHIGGWAKVRASETNRIGIEAAFARQENGRDARKGLPGLSAALPGQNS